MRQTTPQRTIMISINGTGEDAQVFYSYLSPISGLSYIDAPICDLQCNQATYCLYVLDFASTLNGWEIIDISPYGASPILPQMKGANNLSIQTFNPYTSPTTYRFYINYQNSITGKKISIDPQEGNIPR
jgi:hypothetical protein